MMKDRILQIMRKENMTQQEFAKAIDVSPASLSNIFNGKSNPTNNHVSAIHRRFPDISINWLMFGEGDMYETVADETNGEAANVHNTPAAGELLEKEVSLNVAASPSPYDPETYKDCPTLADLEREDGAGSPPLIVREMVKYIDKPQRKIMEIRIFFDDGTFEVFSK